METYRFLLDVSLIGIIFALSLHIAYLKNKLNRDILIKKALNRRGFDEKRKGKKGAVVLFDLDNFKDINDTFGHEAGDLCLEKFYEFISSQIKRKADFACRLSGDEFMMFLESAEKYEAEEMISNMINGLPKFPVVLGRHTIIMSASYGVGIQKNNRGMNKAKKEADNEMYRMKRSRKLRVV